MSRRTLSKHACIDGENADRNVDVQKRLSVKYTGEERFRYLVGQKRLSVEYTGEERFRNLVGQGLWWRPS